MESGRNSGANILPYTTIWSDLSTDAKQMAVILLKKGNDPQRKLSAPAEADGLA